MLKKVFYQIYTGAYWPKGAPEMKIKLIKGELFADFAAHTGDRNRFLLPNFNIQFHFMEENRRVTKLRIHEQGKDNAWIKKK